MKTRHLLSPKLLILILFGLSFSAFSQQVVFNQFIPPNGQNPGSATGFIQDKNGTIWFGTGTGLYSYDGFQLKTFQNNPLDTNSLAGNTLLSICIDNKGMIWLGIRLQMD